MGTKENVDAALVAVFRRITDLYHSENHFLLLASIF